MPPKKNKKKKKLLDEFVGYIKPLVALSAS